MRMLTWIKRISYIFVFCVIVGMLSSVECVADYTLQVRDASAYDVDFDSMSFADYAVFWVQDINLKYQEGNGCHGTKRSGHVGCVNSNYTGFFSMDLKSIALANLNGQDYGIDCSSFTYFLGKQFGEQSEFKSTGDYANVLNGRTDASSVGITHYKSVSSLDDFEGITVGDIILTIDGDGQGHVMCCIGEIDGELSLIHIGSSHLCCNGCSGSGCVISPGRGVSISSSHTENKDSVGQNKRFIRVMSINTYFGSSISRYNTVAWFRPTYAKDLGSGYTGEYSNSSGFTINQDFLKTAGSLVEEGDLIGMPDMWKFEGEPVYTPDRSGLSVTEVITVGTIGEDVKNKQVSIMSISKLIINIVGYLCILYGFFLIIGLIFDKSNNFVDTSALSILSLGHWRLVEDMEEAKKTTKKNGKTFITTRGVIFRAIGCVMFGLVLISGIALQLVLRLIGWLYK